MNLQLKYEGILCLINVIFIMTHDNLKNNASFMRQNISHSIWNLIKIIIYKKVVLFTLKTFLYTFVNFITNLIKIILSKDILRVLVVGN